MCKFEYYNPNPTQRYRRDGKPMGWHKGDCHIRCVAKALEISWEDAIKMEFEEALKRHDAVGSTKCIEAILLRNGYKKGRPFQRGAIKPLVRNMLNNPHNKDYDIVFNMHRHVATGKQGILYDTWNCGNESVLSYWFRKHPED
jgi:hypothetical protein